MNFSKWTPEILHEIEYLVFHNYLVFFLKNKNSYEIHLFRSHRYLLPSTATVKMDCEENMENARYATNDDTPS